jgi:NADPH:quinone reductase-like Zn-dependent oxidoreductase
MDLTTAAAIPETFLTAFDALYLQAKLAMGERLLIHAVGSGIGTSALQLALAMNAEVTGTSRTASKIERCQDLGLVQGIHVTDGRFADNLNVHVILDLVGASYVQENLRALAPRGRIVTIGLMGGARSEIPLNILLQKRVSWMGSVLRSRSLEEKATLMRAFEIHVLPLLATKQIRPVIDAVIPMSNIREAHSSMDGNNTFGKLVLTW